MSAAYGVEPGAHLQDRDDPQHKMVLTGVRNSNGRLLRVRCKCMAEYRDVSDRYYNYDTLATVDSLPAAVEAYRGHLEGRR